MTVCATSRAWAVVRGAAASLLVTAGLAGCGGRGGTPQPDPEGVKPAASSAASSEGAAGGATTKNVAARWRQPFAEVTIDASQGAEPPAGCERPPDLTMTGKSTARLLDEVKKTWDAVSLVNEDGQPLVYLLTFDTDLGPIDLELRAAWAPNHVRNFVALARVGYYDGLCFDRVVHQAAPKEVQADGTTRPAPSLRDVDILEAGCPNGTGVPGFASLGYWLKPEFNPQLKNDEGTVGACRLEAEDTAALKFYISLCRAPALDGYYTVFGKVTRGLDVASRIFREPRIEDEEDQGYHRPLKPVVIRKVTVHPPAVDRNAPTSDNK